MECNDRYTWIYPNYADGCLVERQTTLTSLDGHDTQAWFSREHRGWDYVTVRKETFNHKTRTWETFYENTPENLEKEKAYLIKLIRAKRPELEHEPIELVKSKLPW